jgi:hypothetical protein
MWADTLHAAERAHLLALTLWGAASLLTGTAVVAMLRMRRSLSSLLERGPKLALMPGFGFTDDPPSYSGLYLHPFRVTNAYAMLGELGVVKVGQDEED